MNTKVDNLLLNASKYALHNTLIDNYSLPTCINCVNWNKINSRCNKFNITPPPEVIAKSCGHINWEPGYPF